MGRKFPETDNKFRLLGDRIEDLKLYVNTRFIEIDKKFEGIDKRFNELRDYVDKRFKGLRRGLMMWMGVCGG
uniref:t-SNARE coiled-coil homology domain-containing protein n=1 Tax=Ignisphaera aggregans TaxID=334771 RepID=A0A7J2U5M7_9CREN